MKKIPTLFVRVFDGHKIAETTDKVTPGLEWVLTKPDVVPTIKWDGSCCAVINGEFYKRYDAKRKHKPPAGAIPCCDPDPVTGHWPHWLKVDPNYHADVHFVDAYHNTPFIKDGTYEAVGPQFNGNPYLFYRNLLIRHGTDVLTDGDFRSYIGIKNYLGRREIEGIVFWYRGEPVCKIKRSDFGYQWPVRGKKK